MYEQISFRCYACDKEISNSSDSSQLQKTVKMIYDDMSKGLLIMFNLPIHFVDFA